MILFDVTNLYITNIAYDQYSSPCNQLNYRVCNQLTCLLYVVNCILYI